MALFSLTDKLVTYNIANAVTALAIDKAGPRPYHFRLDPTTGPTTRPGSQKK